ncbi:BQ5605_C122g13306 [Microbotryum silenes-dioicae]|uniref:BQ5605_C122g13306 protein n=1 Tax=Microbotryum silenes-dioicae TaxID=796604 RepID=A0A2X0M136_9BASI|nr:BQ5605_C122g13306 [Microbotryum silenes-dioicae]
MHTPKKQRTPTHPASKNSPKPTRGKAKPPAEDKQATGFQQKTFPLRKTADPANSTYKLALPQRYTSRGIRSTFHASQLNVFKFSDESRFPKRLVGSVPVYLIDSPMVIAYVPNHCMDSASFNKLIAAGLHLGPAVQEYLAKNKVTTIWDLKPGKKEISIADPDYDFHLQRKPISRYTKASAASRNEPHGDRLNKGTQLHQRPRGNGHQADRITSAMEKTQQSQALLADSTAQPITITVRMRSRPYSRRPPALRPAAPTR